MPGLYDNYKLTNSTVVPMFTGTTAPEALQVAQHLQGLYDIAETGANEISTATDGLRSLSKDDALRNELATGVRAEIDAMSAAKDWETRVPAIRALGRRYAQRSAELEAPIKQYQEWEKTLDDKDRNLTTDQKNSYRQMAMAGYKGLQKDGRGRFVGSFSGMDVAKNIDVPKKVDQWMQDAVTQMGGSEIANDNGEWRIKRGNKWERLAPGTIETIIGNAMNLDKEYQDYKNMEAGHTGFYAGKVSDIRNVDPTLLPDVQAFMAKGMTLQEASSAAYANAASDRVDRLARNYAVSKYQKNNNFSESEQSIGAVGVHKAIEAEKAKAQSLMFGDAVTDVGIDLTKQFGSASDIESSLKTNIESIANAQTQVMATKQTIARALKTTTDALTEDQIKGYFTADNERGLGQYRANLETIKAGQEKVNQLNQIMDASMDYALRKTKPGTSYNALKTNATNKLQEVISKAKGTDAFKSFFGTDLKGLQVVDGGHNGVLGDYLVVRDSDGKNTSIPLKAITGIAKKYNVDLKGLSNISKDFTGLDWKSSYKEFATNTRSNSIVMPLLDHTTPDGQLTKAGAYATRVKGLLSGASTSLQVTDMLGDKLGSSDTENMRARISSGNFKVNGITKRDDGKLYVKVSVLVDKNANDPKNQYEEILVAADTNMANNLSNYAIEAGSKFGDTRTMQFGLAMRPGSGYEQILGLSTTGNLRVNDVSAGGKGGSPLFDVVTNPTTNGVTYEIYKLNSEGKRMESVGSSTDAFEVGEWVDARRKEGKSTSKSFK